MWKAEAYMLSKQTATEKEVKEKTDNVQNLFLLAFAYIIFCLEIKLHLKAQ